MALQHRAGVADKLASAGARIFRDHLDEHHRAFYPLLPFVVVGAVDPHGDAWATVLAGVPGFLSAPDASALHVAAPRDPGDPADAGMEDGDAVALLGIELATRRRNRLNGTLHRQGGAGFRVDAEQSFGNCPQYIQLRDLRFVRDPAQRSAHAPEELPALDARARALIEQADTFFVASSVVREDRRRQVDVSHRGGRTGFVRVGGDGVLTIPDFSGNRFFNTLGNLLVNPRAGLVFVDFASGTLLQLSGDTEVFLDAPEIAAFRGAERLWRFRPRRVVLRPDALPLRATLHERGWSPQSLATGTWR